MSRTNKGTSDSRRSDPRRRYAIRTRMYLQCTAAVAPLLLLLAWQSVQSLQETSALCRTSAGYDRALDMSSSYKKFLDGVADAVDSGRLGDGALTALARARAASDALAPDAAGEEAKSRPARLAALSDKLASDRSTAVLVASRGDIVALGKSVDAEVADRKAALGREVADESAAAARSVAVTAGIALFAVLSTVVMIRGLAASITRALRRAIGLTQRIASGRLDGRIEADTGSEIDELLHALGDMNGRLREMVSAVKGTASGICTGADDVSSKVGLINSRAQRQATQIEAISREMEHLDASVAEIARDALATSDAATTTRAVVDDGTGYTRKGLEASNRIVRSVETTGRSIGELSTAIATIGDVTGMIADIAKQTGMLALNASIEAARAGEAGRGFAVVADEVGKLAKRSAESAGEIAGRILSLRTGTETSVAAMDGVADSVNTGAEYNRSVSANFSDIARAAVDVESRSRHIAETATGQTHTTSRIAANMEEIEQLSRDNAGTIEHLADAAGQLAGSADRLRAVVDRFSL